MFGNNDIANELRIFSDEINVLKHELAAVKEQQVKSLELLNNILEGLRYVYGAEKDGFSEIKSRLETITRPCADAPLSGVNVETKSCVTPPAPEQTRPSTVSAESLTEKYNRIINGITSLKDMPEEFKSIGLKFDGNKLVPVSEIESYFIAKNKDDEYYLYPSVQVKSRRGQEATEGEFEYTVNGASLITVKKPCRLLKFEYGYKVLEKGQVQID